MRSRRVLVLRLRVWGLGVDAKSVRNVRKRSQTFAVCSPCVRRVSAVCQQASAPKIVAKRRTVVTFGLAWRSRVSKVSKDRGGPGRETQNCRHFWTRVPSSADPAPQLSCSDPSSADLAPHWCHHLAVAIMVSIAQVASDPSSANLAQRRCHQKRCRHHGQRCPGRSDPSSANLAPRCCHHWADVTLTSIDPSSADRAQHRYHHHAIATMVSAG